MICGQLPKASRWRKRPTRRLRLLKTDLVSLLSLDHDLGGERTGLDVANWLEEQVVAGELDVPVLTVHSENAPGRMNIHRAITAIQRRCLNQPFPGWGFLREAAGRSFRRPRTEAYRKDRRSESGAIRRGRAERIVHRDQRHTGGRAGGCRRRPFETVRSGGRRSSAFTRLCWPKRLQLLNRLN